MRPEGREEKEVKRGLQALCCLSVDLDGYVITGRAHPEFSSSWQTMAPKDIPAAPPNTKKETVASIQSHYPVL